MLRDVYLPEVINGASANGNWELIMTDAAIGIAVFLDDRAAFDKAVASSGAAGARLHLPDRPTARSQGAAGQHMTPAEIVNYWQGQTHLRRRAGPGDLPRLRAHRLGPRRRLRTSPRPPYHQGVDLYGEAGKRLTDGDQFHARLQNEPRPVEPCGGTATGPAAITQMCTTTTTTAWPADAHNLGYAGANAPAAQLLLAWETLTHANNTR